MSQVDSIRSREDSIMSQDDSDTSQEDSNMSQEDDNASQADSNTSQEEENMSEEDDDDMFEDDENISEEDEPVYSRDEVVEEVTKLYELLTGLHIRKEDLLYPPEDGWPEIDVEIMAWLEKDDTVVDLMRHLPYIYREDHTDVYQILTECSVVDYRGPYIEDSRRTNDIYAIEYEYPRPPPYILTLASQTSRDGYCVYINTKRGTATLYLPMYGKDTETLGEPTIENEPAEEGREEEEDWRDHSTWRVSEFFEIMREKFRSLELLPFGEFPVWPNRDSEDGRAKIYREYGWPEPIKEQSECLKKVKEFDDAESERMCVEQKEAERLQIQMMNECRRVLDQDRTALNG